MKKLLEKFYNGETTLEEEQRLREYFLSGETPEELRAEGEYFRAMAGGREEQPSASFAAGLEDLVDSFTPEKQVRRRHLRPVLAWSLSVAASLLIVAGAYFAWIKQAPKDTYEDPKLAYQETRRVLLYVSQQFNKGTGQLARLQEIQTPAREMSRIQTAASPVKDLKYLETLSETQQIMNKYLKVNNNK